MEQRKVQLTGGSTYTVSLPKEWASEHDLEPGTRVDLYPHIDGSLVMRASGDGAGDRTRSRVDVDGLDEAGLRRTVYALYVAGFDEIVFRSSGSITPAKRRAVVDAARRLVGLEVAAEADAEIRIETLLDAADVSIRQTVVQLQFVALSMHGDATAALLGEDVDVTGQVIERDTEADRLSSMVARHFQRSLTDLAEVDGLGLDRPELFASYRTARELERVADHAGTIASVSARLDAPPEGPVADDIETLARESRGVVEDASSVLLGSAGTSAAYDALAERDRVTAALDSLYDDLAGPGDPNAPLLALVIDALQRTAERGGDIAEMGIQAAARDGRVGDPEPTLDHSS